MTNASQQALPTVVREGSSWLFENVAGDGGQSLTVKITDVGNEPGANYNCAGSSCVGWGCICCWVRVWKIKRWRWGRALVLLWLQISVNYAQAVQMVEGQGQLCKVEFHIFLCKHNLIRTGHIYSLNSEEERHSAAKENTTAVLSFSNHKQRRQYYYCHSINISNRLQDSASCWSDTASNDCFVSETCFQHKVCLENNHTLSELPESIWKEQIWASAWQAIDDWKANKDSKRSFVLPWGI